MLVSSSFAILISAAATIASTHQARSHHPTKRADSSTFTVGKRGDQYVNKKFSWYPTDTGTDACTGKNHQDSDFYVAMAAPQFGGAGAACCGKKLSITVNGKTAIANCVDECVANADQCYEAGQLDFTKGLFEYFTGGDLGVGIIYGSWSYTDDNDGPSGGAGGSGESGKSNGSGGSGGSSGSGGDGGEGGDDTLTATAHHTTTTTHPTTPTTHPTSSSVKTSSSVTKVSSSPKPSSSFIQHSPSAQPSSSIPVKSVSSAVPSPSAGVANAGSGLGSSGDSDSIDKISGGLGIDSGDSSNALSLSPNKIFAAIGFIVAVMLHAV
ncbi:hypothetical protein B0H13DRAFT_2580568 [Mycena leptocephala]|nr:hypothetical protein B0H13DRAFT_2580568 [Mycena leptocephala]